MRNLLLAGTSLLALSASVATAAATTIGYAGTGIVGYPVPTTGTYRIEAIGGSGGTEPYVFCHDATGGNGADVAGDFDLTADEVMAIVVGGQGADGPGAFKCDAAGGGTFVVGPDTRPCRSQAAPAAATAAVEGAAGGSFISGTDASFATATGGGNDLVTIMELIGITAPVPEPANLALFGSGALGLLALRRRQRRR